MTSIRDIKDARPDDATWEHLKPYGYAPGEYISKCRHCDLRVWFLDKRATCCWSCAILKGSE